MQGINRLEQRDRIAGNKCDIPLAIPVAKSCHHDIRLLDKTLTTNRIYPRTLVMMPGIVVLFARDIHIYIITAGVIRDGAEKESIGSINTLSNRGQTEQP